MAKKAQKTTVAPRSRAHPGADMVVKISSLVADPQNRRLHNEKNLGMISESLRQVGAARSIVIDEDGVILAGNGVAASAPEAGIANVRIIEADGDELIAVRRRGLTAEQKRGLAMADNRAGELSAWNYDQIRKDAAAGLDLQPWFSEAELHQIINAKIREGKTDPNAVPEMRATKIKRGDLFALGPHRLLCGDSTQREAVSTVMGATRAGIAFTSPPYGDQRSYTGDSVDLSPAYLARFLQAAEPFVDAFAVNLGLMRRDGFVVRYWDTYIAAAEAAGLGLLSWNIWNREGMPMSIGQATAMFPIQHEFIFIFGHKVVELKPTVPNKSAGHVGQSTNRQKDGALSAPKTVTIREHRELGTVLSVQPVKDNADHPAQFPVELARAYIEAFPGDVFEPFGGAGTTIIAAEQIGRECRAIEIAPSYCQVAIDRWEAFTGRKAQKIGRRA